MIVIPAIVGIIRFKKVNKIYYPVILLLCLGVVNECVSRYCAYRFRTNAINLNIFSLIDSLLVVYQFHKWKLFGNGKKIIAFLAGLLIVSWAADNIFFESIRDSDSYFNIFYSFLIVMISIALLNRLLTFTNTSLFKNAEFIICITFIILYTYGTLTEISWKFSAGFSDTFKFGIQAIYIWVNLLCNILFAYAILCMHRKQRYSVPY